MPRGDSHLFFQRKTVTFLPALLHGSARLSHPARVNRTWHLGCLWHAAQMECSDICLLCFKVFTFFFFWRGQVACGILVPQPGIKPGPLTVGAQSLNPWTNKEVLSFYFSIKVIHTPCFVVFWVSERFVAKQKKCPVPPLPPQIPEVYLPQEQTIINTLTLWY